MTTPQCEQITLADLTDYAAGDLSETDAAAVEEHVFSCDACARRVRELEGLVNGIRTAARSAEVGGFVTDEILNRLAREGVRVRTFVLDPGAVVPCAVWDDDEIMALRLRGTFGAATGITLSQRVAGTVLSQATGEIPSGPGGEVIHAVPAAWIRALPVVDIEILLTASETDGEREIGRYTLRHAGAMHRSNNE